MKQKYEVYPKDEQYIRQLWPVVRLVEVESTCRRGIQGGYDIAALEMAAKLVDVLNAPRPAYYPGRYLMSPDDPTGNTFYDTEEVVQGKPGDPHVGEPVEYKLVLVGSDGAARFDTKTDKLVGMLNYLAHHEPKGGA